MSYPIKIMISENELRHLIQVHAKRVADTMFMTEAGGRAALQENIARLYELNQTLKMAQQ